MVSLKQLEKAVAAVEDIGRYTLECVFEETRFVLRVLRPAEELEVYTLVKEDLENIIVTRDWTAAKFYNHHQRLALLSFAIIAMGDLDLSGEYVDTEETSPEGHKIQVPKAQALREHMDAKWSASLLEFLFSKYCELVARLNDRISVKVDYEKLDATIARLKEQLSTLEKLRTPELTPEDVIQSVAAAKAERRSKKEVLMPEVKLPTPNVPESPSAESQAQPSNPVPPAPEPVPPQTESPRSPRKPSYPEEVAFDPRNPEHRGRMAFVPEPLRGDSFMDSSDPEAAIQAENIRQAEYYRAQRAAEEARARQVSRVAPPTPDQRPTFRKPPEDLGGEGGSAPQVSVNPMPSGQNPRYNPRR